MTAARRSWWIAAIAAIAAALPAAAEAQAPAPHRGSIEITGGLGFTTGFDLGSQSALETRNSTTDQTPVTLFSSNSQLDGAAGGLVRLGVYLTRTIAVEGGLLFSKPKVSTRVTGDFEQADNATLTETITHYVIDASGVYHLEGLSFAGGRGVPFLLGGAGYVRDVHEGGALVETGSEFHGGGGFKLWFGGGKPRIGLRTDFGFSSRDGGFDFESGRRTVPTGGVSVTFLF